MPGESGLSLRGKVRFSGGGSDVMDLSRAKHSPPGPSVTQPMAGAKARQKPGKTKGKGKGKMDV